MKTFEWKTVIRETQLDAYGHVNNANYMTLFEEARWELITAGGYGLATIQKFQKGPILLEAHIQYKKELKARTPITIVSEPKEYEGKVGVLRQTILNDESQVCSIGDFVIGFFDLKERKIIEPSQEWLAALGLS